jgi:hypothetical protein
MEVVSCRRVVEEEEEVWSGVEEDVKVRYPKAVRAK